LIFIFSSTRARMENKTNFEKVELKDGTKILGQAVLFKNWLQQYDQNGEREEEKLSKRDLMMRNLFGQTTKEENATSSVLKAAKNIETKVCPFDIRQKHTFEKV
jgi:hypothetical protein